MKSRNKANQPNPWPAVILIGLMGAGKSSIGRRLSEATGMPLIDLDDYIVEKAGRSIPELFAHDGEAYFRRLEHECLCEVIGQQAIIATGGGIVMLKENRRLLRSHPPVIWLKASPKFLAKRIDGDSNRPLIAGGDTLTRLKELARLRYPLYKKCATLTFPRADMKKPEIVTAILNHLQNDEYNEQTPGATLASHTSEG